MTPTPKDLEEAREIVSWFSRKDDDDTSHGLLRTLIDKIATALAEREAKVKEDCARIIELKGLRRATENGYEWIEENHKELAKSIRESGE